MPFAQLESGEPFGLMFVARRGDEGKLIGLM
jgi:Asp-tRNA(Asn)/Glu-tRNA(Gln) amidotransferase A subunit family amidase